MTEYDKSFNISQYGERLLIRDERKKYHRRGKYIEGLVAGLTAELLEAFKYHENIAKMTSSDPRVLASIEEAIVRLSPTPKRKITFYYSLGHPTTNPKYTQAEIAAMGELIINMAKSQVLFDDPALTQKLFIYTKHVSPEFFQCPMGYQAYFLMRMQFGLSEYNRK